MDAIHNLFPHPLDIALAAGAILSALCFLRGAYLVLTDGDSPPAEPLNEERWRATVRREYLRLPRWERERVLELTRIIQALEAGSHIDSDKESGHGCD